MVVVMISSRGARLSSSHSPSTTEDQRRLSASFTRISLARAELGGSNAVRMTHWGCLCFLHNVNVNLLPIITLKSLHFVRGIL